MYLYLYLSPTIRLAGRRGAVRSLLLLLLLRLSAASLFAVRMRMCVLVPAGYFGRIDSVDSEKGETGGYTTPRQHLNSR